MVVLLGLVFCWWLAVRAAAQECALITENEIASRIEGSSLPPGSASLQIIQKNINCVAVGLRVRTYRFVTGTANVTYLSPQLQNGVFQVDVACVFKGAQSEWTSIESRSVTNEKEIGLLLSTETRRSCSSCSSIAEDELYHCQGEHVRVRAFYVRVMLVNHSVRSLQTR